jgi:hypothetical protein
LRSTTSSSEPAPSSEAVRKSKCKLAEKTHLKATKDVKDDKKGLAVEVIGKKKTVEKKDGKDEFPVSVKDFFNDGLGDLYKEMQAHRRGTVY